MQAVGLTQAFARTVGIAVDHRRHNKNAETMATNVERLNQYKNKMILFPRRADKPKKGEINDSTADQLKNAVQNTAEGVFALPAKSNEVELQKITPEMKNFRVYHKLRTERINRRYAGKREKTARDAEAAKK